MNDEKELTIDFTDDSGISAAIEQVIRGMQVDTSGEGLGRLQEGREESLLVAEARGSCRLSGATRKLEEERLAKLYRKKRALRNRKKYTRKKGTVHPKRKAATRRRRLEKNWRDNPFGVVIHGYGAHNVDRKLWDLYIQPLFSKYKAEELTLRKKKRDVHGREYGTKANPYTIYSLTVVHKTDGVVFDGAGLELYMLSS